MNMRGLLAALMLVFGVSVLGASGASAQGLHLFATLKGGHENPEGAGDADARGSAYIVFRSATVICYSIFVDFSSAPVAAHIHEGHGSRNGGIVVTLNTPGGSPGFSNGCTVITPTLSAQIRGNPYGFYVNVHTGTHPAGALRGQLF